MSAFPPSALSARRMSREVVRPLLAGAAFGAGLAVATAPDALGALGAGAAFGADFDAAATFLVAIVLLLEGLGRVAGEDRPFRTRSLFPSTTIIADARPGV